jgi:hypothetical protein
MLVGEIQSLDLPRFASRLVDVDDSGADPDITVAVLGTTGNDCSEPRNDV